jgi:1-acyl-sn-glycerol-3-phosphate acyltransferase
MNLFIQIFGSILVIANMAIIQLPVCLIFWSVRDIKTRVKLIGWSWKLFSKAVMLGSFSRVYCEDNRKNRTYSMPNGLYVANHQSFMDIPLTLHKFLLPPIMKKEVLRLPLFGILAGTTGAIPVDRKDPDSRKKVLLESQKRILKGTGVQIYPEATRSKTDFPKSYDQIKTTLIDFCFEHKVPVTACSLYGTRHVLTKSGKLKPFKHLGIILHPEFYPEDFESKEQFSKTIWECIVNGHKKMYDRFEPLNSIQKQCEA